MQHDRESTSQELQDQSPNHYATKPHNLNTRPETINSQSLLLRQKADMSLDLASVAAIGRSKIVPWQCPVPITSHYHYHFPYVILQSSSPDWTCHATHGQ